MKTILLMLGIMIFFPGCLTTRDISSTFSTHIYYYGENHKDWEPLEWEIFFMQDSSYFPNHKFTRSDGVTKRYYVFEDDSIGVLDDLPIPPTKIKNEIVNGVKYKLYMYEYDGKKDFSCVYNIYLYVKDDKIHFMKAKAFEI